jgi:hypothetical protein
MPVEAFDFTLLQKSISALGPTRALFSGYRNSSPGVKRPGCEVNKSSPSGAKDRNRSKGKFQPRTGHEGSDGEKRYISTHSLTSTLDGGG